MNYKEHSFRLDSLNFGYRSNLEYVVDRILEDIYKDKLLGEISKEEYIYLKHKAVLTKLLG